MTKFVSQSDLRVLEIIGVELSKKWPPDWYCRFSGKVVFFTAFALILLGLVTSLNLTITGLCLLLMHAGFAFVMHRRFGRYPGIPRWAVSIDLMDDDQKQRISQVLGRMSAADRSEWESSRVDAYILYKLMVFAKMRLG